MAEEVDYEALPTNAGLTVRLPFFAPQHLLIPPPFQVNMLAGAMVSRTHGRLCHTTGSEKNNEEC